MKAKRKRHDNAFKGRVALEALKGIKSIQAIAKEFDLHPMQVSEWKRKLQESLPGAFERGKKSDNDFEAEREKLHSKIGQLTIELDFAIKKSKQLGLAVSEVLCLGSVSSVFFNWFYLCFGGIF